MTAYEWAQGWGTLGFAVNFGLLVIFLVALWWLGQHPEDWIEPWCRGDYHKKDNNDR